MLIKGFPLIKFQNADRIEDLQNGLIYMNSLEWFRKHENTKGDAVIGDKYEAMFHVNEGKFIIPDTGEEFEIKDQLFKTSASNDYVYCMFGVNPYSNDFKFTNNQKENMKKFGDTALLILDKDEFLDRIKNEALRNGYGIYEDFVHYYDEKQDSVNHYFSLLSGIHNIAFWKRRKYLYQQEFRILIHTKNHETDHLKLNIGDIRDISKVFKTSQLLNAEVVRI